MAFPPLVSSGENALLDLHVCLASSHHSGLKFKNTSLKEASPDLFNSFTALISVQGYLFSKNLTSE